MSDATLRIKNLSIALEALSRVAQCGCYITIENLLRDEIEEFQKEKEKDNQWPRQGRSTRPVPDFDTFQPLTKA